MRQPEVFQPSGTNQFPEIDNSFSLVLGGPLYQLYLRARLARPHLELVRRRIVCLWTICWIPPLIFSLVEGHAFSGVPIPFLFDLGTHVRFMAVLPLLLEAELIVDERIRGIVHQFLERGIIATEDRARFENLIASTMRLRNSALAEVLLLLFAFGSHWVVSEYLALPVDAWYAFKVGGIAHFTAAGYWYVLVSLPILRFLILRWYYHLFLWYWFLWHVRRLPLHLNLFHPDRAGGLGFLAGSVRAFTPVLAAQTILLAGTIANRIWHAGATLPSFKIEIVGVVVCLMLLVLAPLTFFVIQLDQAGRKARREYGDLASRYVDDFYCKWIQKQKVDGEPLLGTADIQSLADLGNGYGVVSNMRMLPLGKETVIQLVIILILPLLPLTLTMVPLGKIIDQVVKLVL